MRVPTAITSAASTSAISASARTSERSRGAADMAGHDSVVVWSAVACGMGFSAKVVLPDARGGRNLKDLFNERRREVSAVGFRAWAAINVKDVHADFSRSLKRVWGRPADHASHANCFRYWMKGARSAMRS